MKNNMGIRDGSWRERFYNLNWDLIQVWRDESAIEVLLRM